VTPFLPIRVSTLACLAASLGAVIWLGLATTARAAEEGPGASQPADEPARLTTSDIEQRTDAVRSRLSVAQKAIDNRDFNIDALTVEIDRFEAAVSEVTTSLTENLEMINPLVYDRILQSLVSRQAQARNWDTKFIAYTEQLAQLRSALRTDAEFFDKLMNSQQAGDLPPALTEKIALISRDIAETRSRLAGKLNDLVSLRGRIAVFQSEIDAALERLNQSEMGRRGHSSGVDEPLLQALRKPWLSPAVALTASAKILKDTWTDYSTQHRTQLITLFSVLPLLLLLAWLLQRSALEQADALTRDQARSLFACRPFATALLVWLTLGPGLLTTDLPWVLIDITSVLLILPLLRLLSSIVRPGAFLGPVRGLLILALIVLTAALIYPTGPVHHLTTLGVALATIPVLLYLVKIINSLPTGERVSFAGLIRGYAKVGVAAMVVTVGVLFYGASGIAERLVYALMIANLVILVIPANELILRTGWEILLGTRGVGRINAIRHHPLLVHRRGIFIIRLLMVVFMLAILPSLFPLIGLLGASISEFVSQKWTFGNLELSIGNLLALAVGIVLALYIPRFVRFILDEDVVPRLSVDPGSGAAATRLIYYVLVSIGLVLALASAGIELGQVAFIIGALGVGIGFGLQNIVNDFVSGIVVAFERPFQVGDTIEVGKLWGRVRHIGLRASTIRTYEGAEVIVPNASLISGQVINWTLSDRRRRIDIPVGVSYGSDPEKVQEILVQVVADHPACLREPPPKALFRDFGDSSLNFELRFWTPDADKRLETLSDVAIRINNALKAAGITIPFPQRDVHMISGDEKEGPV